MRRLFLTAVVGLMVGVTGQARAGTVLSFDDVTADIQVSIPSGYGGFDWSNTYARNAAADSITPSGYDNGRVSGDYVAWTPGDATITRTDASPFTFNSVFLTAAWFNDLNVLVSGYRGSDLVYSRTVVVDTDAPRFFRFDYEDITSLTILTSGGVDDPSMSGSGRQLAADDMTFNAAVSAVPEPSTLAMAGIAALIGLGYTWRRRRSAA